MEGDSLGGLFNISTLLQTRRCCINDISPVPSVFRSGSWHFKTIFFALILSSKCRFVSVFLLPLIKSFLHC